MYVIVTSLAPFTVHTQNEKTSPGNVLKLGILSAYNLIVVVLLAGPNGSNIFHLTLNLVTECEA